MVDCRLCKHHYTIFRSESGTDENIMVCCIRKEIIEKDLIKIGDCDVYLDRDDSEN